MPNFRALQGDGGLLVAPILQLLILNRDPVKVLAFVDEICKWDFKRIIPCHLSNDIRSSPSDLRDAFNFLKEKKDISFPFSLLPQKKLPLPDPRDCKLLQDASDMLTQQGVLNKVAPLIKSK